MNKEILLTKVQKAILETSEADVKNGYIISQEEMMKRNYEWLKNLSFK